MNISAFKNNLILYYIFLVQGEPRHIPDMLSFRPTRTVPFHLPFSFVMAPQQVRKIYKCTSLEEVLSEVICLEEAVIESRIRLIREQKLDHVLMTFSANDVAVKLASIDGISELLMTRHPEVGVRFDQMKEILKGLSGPNKFQDRLDACAGIVFRMTLLAVIYIIFLSARQTKLHFISSY